MWTCNVKPFNLCLVSIASWENPLRTSGIRYHEHLAYGLHGEYIIPAMIVVIV